MHTTNKPPKPAAVRAALLYLGQDPTIEERDAYLADGRAGSYVLLRDHIRAVAQEMRAESIAMLLANTHDPFVEPGIREAEIAAAKLLAVFADRLEGRES